MSRRNNGFGCLVSKGKGKPWLARWMFNRKIFTKSTGEVDRKKAEKVLEKLTRPYRESNKEKVIENLEIQIKRLKAEIKCEKLEVKNLWKEYENHLWEFDITDTTKKIYKGIVTKFADWMAHKTWWVGDIKKEWIDEYLRELSSKVSAQTWNSNYTKLRKAWKTLSGKFGLDETLFDGYKHKAVSKTKRTALTNEEVKALLDGTKDNKDLHILFLTGIYTGLRISDCANLKWRDIDFEKKIINVTPKKTKRYNTSVQIPLHPILEEELKTFEQTGEYVSETNARDYVNSTLSGKLTTLFRRLGINASFHYLRHTFVSNAINSGMSPMLVQRIVGHSSIDMTDAYFHENASKMLEGINNLPTFI